VKELIAWFNEKNFVSVRSGTLYVTVWMTWLAFDWAGQFAYSSDKAGSDIALIIAAVTAPITALQMFIFKVYSESRAN
jgi:hypothetical protein